MEQTSIDAAIRAKLEALVASGPVERKSKLETTLDPHRDLIAAAVAKGHTYRTITTTLREAGLKASPETIRRYVQRIGTNGKGKPRVAARRTVRGSRPHTTPATPSGNEEPSEPISPDKWAKQTGRVHLKF